MKKKIFLVSAFVAMAMSAMFVACSSKNEPSNGCTCTFTEGGKSYTESWDRGMMANYGATTCSELSGAIRGAHASHGMSVSVTCR